MNLVALYRAMRLRFGYGFESCDANGPPNVKNSNNQGQILAVWILAVKLPNSDLNFAVDVWVDFFLLFLPRKRPEKSTKKKSPQKLPGTLIGKIPLEFLQRPSLDTHCETQAHFSSPTLLVGSRELVLKVPKQGQFHAAIRMTRKRCDSCAQVALGTRTVSRRNFWDAESLAKRCGETCH